MDQNLSIFLLGLGGIDTSCPSGNLHSPYNQYDWSRQCRHHWRNTPYCGWCRRVTRHASYTSGTGTSALTFTYQLISGDIDLDGISLSSSWSQWRNNQKTWTEWSFTANLHSPSPQGYWSMHSTFRLHSNFSDKTVTNINKTCNGIYLDLQQGKSNHHIRFPAQEEEHR